MVGRKESLREVMLLFFKLGAIGFGGPAALIALMENEVVRRRQWLSREQFLDLLAATFIIPGPNAMEMAAHIGHRRAGGLGLIAAGCCFILPAALMVTLIAWAYTRYGSIPQANALLYGVKPVVMAIILQALWGLTSTAIKNRSLAIVGAAGLVSSLAGVNELVILLASGLVLALLVWVRRKATQKINSFVPLNILLSSLGAVTGSAGVPFGMLPLFLFFFKVGSVLFGSGYVLLAFLRADLVVHWHWLNEDQLLDAVAVGQLTPGPLFTTATFIGYILGGLQGAFWATVGIFLPAFILVAISGPFIPKIRQSEIAGAFLDGVIAASLSLMIIVSFQLGRAALVDLRTLLLLVIALGLLLRSGINSFWLILAGAAAGLVCY